MNKKIIFLVFLLILLVGCRQKVSEGTTSDVKTGLEGDVVSLNETDTDFDDLNSLDSELNEIEGLDI